MATERQENREKKKGKWRKEELKWKKKQKFLVLSALFIIFADVMRIDIITVLPEMLEGFFNESILARAQKKGLAEIHLHNLRDYTLDKWKRVDDYPYGGSAGMVMQCEPIDRCIAALKAEREYDDVIYVSPDGETFNQKIANEMSMQGNLIILCGHYKGIDQRVRDHLITREISVGDYVLTGGENMWNFGVSVKLGCTSQYEGVSKAQLIAENEELKCNDTLLDQKIQEFMKIVAELQQKMKWKKNKKQSQP